MKNYIAGLTEEGVAVELNGKFWGIEYEDGQCCNYGWVNADKAIITQAEFIKKPEDLTYKNSHYIKELQKGKIVKIKKVTVINTLIE